MKKESSYKTEAIILRSQDIKEYDRLYTVFSREKGKIQVLGIGTRKAKAKLASGLEPITKSELFCIQGRKWDRVAGVIIDDQFPLIKKELNAIVEVKKIFKIMEDLLVEGEPGGEVYQTLDLYLATLEKNQKGNAGEVNQIAPLVVVWKTIFSAGYNPELFHCAACSKPITKQPSYKFKIPEGLICKSCEDKGNSARVEISENSLKALRFITVKRPEISLKLTIPEITAKQLKYLSKIFLQQILDKESSF